MNDLAEAETEARECGFEVKSIDQETGDVLVMVDEPRGHLAVPYLRWKLWTANEKLPLGYVRPYVGQTFHLVATNDSVYTATPLFVEAKPFQPSGVISDPKNLPKVTG